MPPKVLLASRLPDREDATALAAARLAEQIGGELILVYVAVELSSLPHLQVNTGEDPDDLRRRMVAEIESRVHAYLERHVPGGPAGVRLVEGDVCDEITRIAVEERVDYLVIGTRGESSLKQVILGSTSQKILRHAPCPVLVVPAAPE